MWYEKGDENLSHTVSTRLVFVGPPVLLYGHGCCRTSPGPTNKLRRWNSIIENGFPSRQQCNHRLLTQPLRLSTTYCHSGEWNPFHYVDKDFAQVRMAIVELINFEVLFFQDINRCVESQRACPDRVVSIRSKRIFGISRVVEAF